MIRLSAFYSDYSYNKGAYLMKQVTKGQWGGFDTYILHSRELEVTLLPRLGNNVIALRDLKEERQILRRPDESDLDFFMQKALSLRYSALDPTRTHSQGTISI
jgi:aldose 1-epimerase